MTTLTIHHRPALGLAAAAAASVLAAGTAAGMLSDHAASPGAPGGQPQVSVSQDAPPSHHFHPTTSGGRIQVGP
jgi:hypothetical protein